MILSSSRNFFPASSHQSNLAAAHKVVDTVAPLEFFASGGYYVVDKEIFRNKIYAMQAATRKNLKPSDIVWVFNDDAYKNLDWKTPSGLALTEWYKMRALQLREKYDYLMLAFSGGGDSSNVLDSFVLNNIHLDEVVVHWPRSQTSGKYNPSMSTDATNFSSEWDFLIEPKLKWLEKVAPNVKITIYDNLVDMRAEEPVEEFVELTTKHTWNAIKRYSGLDDVFFARQEKYKNCAIMLGVNPPLPSRLGRHFLIRFGDPVPSTYQSGYTSRGMRTVEFFYWTPDMPELVREQAHALLTNLRLYPEFLDLVPEHSLDRSKSARPMPRRQIENQRRWIKSILYPTYDPHSLQVDKNTSPCHSSEWFSWIYDNPHSTEIIQPHRSALTSHQNLIDSSFFIQRDGIVHDYYMYFSKPYHVGDLT